MAKKQSKEMKPIHRFICIRSCFDSLCRTWEVGDVIEAPEAPMPKHFVEVEENERPDPIKELRKKLEEFEVEWDKDWDQIRLQRELAVAETWERHQAEKKRKMEEVKKVEA